jgi:hypothetical protein
VLCSVLVKKNCSTLILKKISGLISVKIWLQSLEKCIYNGSLIIRSLNWD